MRFDIDCMLGHKHKSKTKWGAKKLKHRCTPAHIFWSFLLHQVRRGELALEDILSDAMAALSGGGGDSSGNGENGGGGGCGNSDIVGYTGNSPPVALSTIKNPKWQNWKTLLVSVLLVCGTAIAVMSCKKGCDPKTAKPGDECYQDTTTVTDPYAKAKKECENKSHPDSTYSWNDALKLCEATYTGQPPVEKEDVIIWYNVSSTNLCDNTDRSYAGVMSRTIIDSLRNLPTTGLIIPRVYCPDNRGPPESRITRMLDSLITWEPMGLTFRPDTMDVTNFDPADSIRAQTIKLLLTRKTQY
ncbi:MAG: hypothetical protein FWH36_09655 [Lentimicrobiaceae bacterium]|nr:hypothetical protein [Lentimicrobiaceae bacterium]